MDRSNLQRTKELLKRKSLYFSLVIAFIIMMLIFPNDGRFKYEYHRGKPWGYETLIAPIDFPILKSNQEILKEREDISSSIVPYYILDNSILDNKISNLTELLAEHKIGEDIESSIVESLERVYSSGVVADEQFSIGSVKNSYIIVQKNRRAIETLIADIYNCSKAKKFIAYNLSSTIKSSIDVDSLFIAINIDNFIEPNLIYDQRTTDLVHREAIDYISPTKGMVYSGQLIVAEGEIVTSDIEQLLDSYKAEYSASMGYDGEFWQFVLGYGFFLLVLLGLIYISIYLISPSTLSMPKKFNFLLFIVVLGFVFTVFIKGINVDYLYAVPYAVLVLYMMAFFKPKVVLPIYLLMLLPLLVMVEKGLELYLINLFAGGIALLSFNFLNRGWLQFLNSLIIFIALFLVHESFNLMEGDTLLYDYYTPLYLFLNALFVVAAYPLVFLLEKIFSLVSSSTLKDLSDTNNKLLQELARLAPGTFQHSLQVANLSERAVREIGGDARLVKVGAMYHDVGKIVNPQCFIENQAPGVNYHSGLTPMESAKEIIRHVADGLELAKRYNLPDVIMDYISSHHGHSQTGYFYMQYCNNGGDPANIGDFTYNGTLPTSKEQVVMMMADAVEAASRSLKDFSAESISKLVDSITSQRITDSQLVNANISFKEINIVKDVFKRHLGEIYHARIAYPTKSGDGRTRTAVQLDHQ